MSQENNRAVFHYGFDITGNNQNIDFKNASLGSQITAVLTKGNYTATSMATEVARAFNAADLAAGGSNVYTVTVGRTKDPATGMKFTISSTGSFLSILFGSGTNSTANPGTLLGMGLADLTGAVSYTGASQSGKILLPDYATYNYLGPTDIITNDGVRTVSASGIKEALIFAQFYFLQGQWQYINNLNGNTQMTQWRDFMAYITQQLKFEFTPSVYETGDTEFYQVTLETTPQGKDGLSFTFKMMRNVGLFRFYDTGLLTFRKVP